MAEIEVRFTLNGRAVKRRVDANQTLANFLNEDLGMTGTKTCCERGLCRACTVGIAENDRAPLAAIQSCILPLAAVQGKSVTTVEGLGTAEKPSKLQQAFLKSFSFQCGFSTPGFLMGATALIDQLKRNPIGINELDDAIKGAVGQNICRCTGYVKYYEAIREAILDTPGCVKV